MPAPKKWYNWFTYRILPTNKSDDLCSYVSATIAQSANLKKRYKTSFYNMLYMCPEWQEADATLATLNTITETGTLCKQLEKWEQSCIFKAYTQSFPEDQIDSIYKDHLSRLYTPIFYKTGHCTHFGVTVNKWGNIESMSIKKYADSLHLPFLIHFIRYGSFLLTEEHGRIDRISVIQDGCDDDKAQISVVLRNVDVQILQKILSTQKESFIFECPLDPDSLALLQKCSPVGHDLRPGYDWHLIEFCKVGKSMINACKQSGLFLPLCFESAIASSQWRYKIIEPWVVLLSLCRTACILNTYSFSYIDLLIETLVCNNWVKCVKEISALNISQSQYNLLSVIEKNLNLTNPLNSHVLTYIHSKAGIASVEKYSDNTINTVLKLYTQISKISDFSNKKSNLYYFCGGLAQFVCMVGLSAVVSYVYNCIYKKYRPLATLYNPLKLLWPRVFGKKTSSCWNEGGSTGAAYFTYPPIPYACKISE